MGSLSAYDNRLHAKTLNAQTDKKDLTAINKEVLWIGNKIVSRVLKVRADLFVGVKIIAGLGTLSPG
jgi:hypothetical protein